MKLLILVVLSISLVGCATVQGNLQIQKKCKVVQNSVDTFVCEQP